MTHEAWMRAALDLARKGLGRTSPNPTVGAVLVHEGKIVAQSYTAPAGGDHAELSALKQVGFGAQGMELYTTLEPCNHFGKTPPCTEAIIKAGVSKVIVGALDPNPQVNGGGVAALRAQGIEVVTGVLEPECARLNEAFNFAIVHERPFVVLKAAISLDGRIATHAGHSQWITAEPARAAGHRLRDELDAICVGVGTVLADDPSLTARFEGSRNPVRVVLDSTLRTPPSAKLAQTAKQTRTIIATIEESAVDRGDRQRALEALGVEVLRINRTPQGQVKLDAMLRALYAQGINSVLVEGGGEVHGSFVDSGLVNKVVFFMAPVVIGGAGAPVAVKGKGAAQLGEALWLRQLSYSQVGQDLMICGYTQERDVHGDH